MEFCKRIRVLGLYVYVSTFRMKRRGINDKIYSEAHNKLKAIKRGIWEANGGRCEGCGAERGIEELEIHHIIPRCERPDLLLERSNMELLCRRCYMAKHFVENKYDDIR